MVPLDQMTLYFVSLLGTKTATMKAATAVQIDSLDSLATTSSQNEDEDEDSGGGDDQSPNNTEEAIF